MITRDRNPTHRLLVEAYDNGMFEVGELVRYDGPPNWKFEPLDAAAKAVWLKDVADPVMVERQNWSRGRQTDQLEKMAEFYGSPARRAPT